MVQFLEQTASSS